MSFLPYPEDRYHGATGEASATLRPDATPGEIQRGALTARYLATGASTDGRPGDFLHVPPGGVHGFRNESGEPASMLILFTPGAPREDYFERVHTVGEMTPEDRDEFFRRHDTFWL